MGNTKKVNSKTVIKKHIEVVRKPMHLMQLNKGLNLRQQRFFNLAILKVDNGISHITWHDYKEIFSDETDHFYSAAVIQDIEKLISLNIQTELEKKIVWDNVFLRVEYDKEKHIYSFIWSPYMKERIENVRSHYIQQDLKTLAHFKNKYSFIWYDYFKSNFRQWKWNLTREEVVELLQVGGIKTYTEQHSVFFKQCIESPLEELNNYTEYKIIVTPIKERRSIVGYEFKRFTNKDVVYSVSENQLEVLQEVVDRYGDTGAIMREIASFALIDADAVPYLTDLFFEIQNFKKFIALADSYTADSFKEIVALAIKKDNQFKMKLRELYDLKASKPTIYEFIEDKNDDNIQSKKVGFYNWLEERE